MTGWPPSTARPPRSSTPSSTPAIRRQPTSRGAAVGERAAAAAHLGAAEPVRPQIVATMRRYLEQIACVLRPGSVTGADLALRSFAGVPGRDRTRGHQHRAGDPSPHRGLQALVGQTARAEQGPASPPPPWRTGSAPCGCSSSGSTSGAGRRRPPRVPMFPGRSTTAN